MKKIKIKKKPQPNIDMTPMVDTFCVVLTFLMLTAQMRQPEPIEVNTPFSISETPTPDFNTMSFLLSDDGVFMNFDNGPDTLLRYRPKILVEMGNLYGIEFTEEQQREFEKYPSSIGVPMQNMVQFLNTPDAALRKELQVGIPIDSADNQLSMWILCARQVNPNIQAAIRGDATTHFSTVEKILDVLQTRNVNRFSLVTNLESATINLDEIPE
ncbi:MAG: biopolymer transporter ExbD [Bacteroidales bacterium]|jgi:biopolymer transport protein ExbD|nr:biopolymer transporter ExbD [Bacteroidales bacterium]